MNQSTDRSVLYQTQTQKALDNFAISGLVMPRAFIRALGLLKACCAEVNQQQGTLPLEHARWIQRSAMAVADGQYDEQFPVDVFQTGSGTSTNMNANEVIATLASQELGEEVHPNDHVNQGQSSNDVIPSTMHIAASLLVYESLLPALSELADSIDAQGQKHQHVIKTGRTHLMDAMPLTVAQELSGWAAQVRANITRLEGTALRITELAIGGTAVGTGVNTSADFGQKVAARLGELTGLPFSAQANRFAGISAQDTAVELSGQLNTLAVGLMKISNDLRWMNSGPQNGLAEIQLPKLQAGSSIMPGKVNPVIPEAVAMACAQVMGNHTAITVGGQSGNFQLNVMLPMLAYNLLQSVTLMANGARHLSDQCIKVMTFNQDKIAQKVSANPILVTGLNSTIGYEQAAKIAEVAYGQERSIIDVAEEMTDLSRDELEELLDPLKLTRPNQPNP